MTQEQEAEVQRLIKDIDVTELMRMLMKHGNVQRLIKDIDVTELMGMLIIGNRNVMRAQPLIYTERWVAAFQGQTALPTAVTIASVGRTQKANDVVCGKARGLSIFDSLTVALTTA